MIEDIRISSSMELWQRKLRHFRKLSLISDAFFVIPHSFSHSLSFDHHQHQPKTTSEKVNKIEKLCYYSRLTFVLIVNWSGIYAAIAILLAYMLHTMQQQLPQPPATTHNAQSKRIDNFQLNKLKSFSFISFHFQLQLECTSFQIAIQYGFRVNYLMVQIINSIN